MNYTKIQARCHYLTVAADIDGEIRVTLKLLVTGDIHIGRRPTRVAETDATRWSCKNMWELICERAVSEQVDAVLLSGDVVDHDNRFYEATGPLEGGIRHLEENKIKTYAVSGNHDYDVLHRLAGSIDSEYFQVLGRSGRWEETTLDRDGEPVLRVQGWSFPSRHEQTSPLRNYHLSVSDDLATLGILHADLENPGSDYAPVTRDELHSKKVHFWVLGHIHVPKLIETPGEAPILYPGSPQSMKPSETGLHGPWLLTIHGPHEMTTCQLPLSRVRYDPLSIDLEGVDSEAEFESRIIQSVKDHLEEVAADNSHLELLNLRLTLTGSTSLCGKVDKLSEKVQDIDLSFDRVRVQIIGRIDNDTKPDIDLCELAKRTDPLGQLACLMLSLNRDPVDETAVATLRDATKAMKECYDAGVYTPISEDERLDKENIRNVVFRQGVKILESLRLQREA